MSEARSEHEWVNVHGTTCRVTYSKIFGWQLLKFWPCLQGGQWMVASQNGAAAEIAKLAGLVPPGGEEEKG